MSNYTKTTNFAAKDSLPSGNAAKIVKGAEIDTEFNNIAVASGTKADKASPVFTGTVTLPVTNADSLSIGGDGVTVTGIKDEDDMASNSATKLASQQSIKAYVDSQVTAQDLDVTDGTTSISIDLDSEALSLLGGTGVTSTASGNGVTMAIDATVATLSGSQTLTNKSLATAVVTCALTTNSTIDGRDVAVDGTKLDTVETNADVTDTANVTAAGALMDSEVTNLAQVKAFDSTDYATAAQGTTADAALPKAGGAMTGAITTNSTFDGRDVATDGTKLDGIEASADVTDTANVTAAGALMDSELTSIASVKALDQGVATTDSPTFAAATVTGEITANGGIALGDNDKATFGAGDDLQIYHDGSSSFIKDAGTGNLIIQATDLQIANADNTANYIRAFNGGAVDLRYAGAAKLATTATGIDVTGTAVTDNAVISGYIDFQTGGANKGNIYTDASTMIINTQGTNTTLNTNGGNVGIGIASPETALHLYSTGNTIARITSGTSSIAGLDLGDTAGTDVGRIRYDNSNNSLAFTVATNEAMRIDSSGNLLVGCTLAGASNGVTLHSSGYIQPRTNTGIPAIYADREGSDGSIIELRKDGTAVGTIGTTGGKLYIGSQDGSDAFLRFESNEISPCAHNGDFRDNAINLGKSDSRFKDLYLSNAVHATHINLEDAGGSYRTALDFDTSSNLKISTGASAGARAITFFTENVEQMRLDASGNLLVGKTAAGAATVGVDLQPSGIVVATRSSNISGLFNRTTSDGSIVDFRRDNTTVGSIQSRAGVVSTIILDPRSGQGAGLTGAGAGGDTLRHITPTNESGTEVDGKVSLGNSNNGFKDLYLSSKVKLQASGGNQHSVGVDANDLIIRSETAGNETARFTYGGDLLVGTTDNAVFNNTSENGINLKAGGDVQIAVDSGEALYLNRMGTDGRVVNFRKAGSFVAGIDVTSTTVTYNTSSDQRLKDNIVDAPSASDDIDAIQVRSFDWKADGSHQKYGMIAQELQAVAPEAVSGDADSEDMMGVDYSKLVPMLVKEIQSLRNRVAQLEE